MVATAGKQLDEAATVAIPVQIVQCLHQLLGNGLHNLLWQLGVLGQQLKEVSCTEKAVKVMPLCHAYNLLNEGSLVTGPHQRRIP